MPKKKETLTEDEVSVDVLGLSHKKHKKHKHKKHKKRKGGLDDGDDSDNSPDTPGDGFKPGLKLKIKIGGQTFGETRVPKPEVNETGSDESTNIDVVGASPSIGPLSPVSGNPPKKAKKMDEEEAWLAALEAGRLEEVDDELRRMKDPTLMTARQRSLLESKAQKEKEEAAAPVVAETKVLSEEMIQKKIIKAKKRKEQAEEKLQKDKKQTLERLLKKSDSKPRTKKVVKKVDVPRMKYIDSEITGRSLSFPVGTSYPLKAQIAKEPPPPVLCGVKGCKNRKKYSCSKTGIPLCSLNCYKKNMANAGRLAITV